MSYGFLLYNTNGKLIANSDDFNYGLISEGTVTCNAGWTTISWSNTGEIPLVFFRFTNFTSPVSRFIAIQSISQTGITIGVFGTNQTNGRLQQVVGDVDYRIFKTFKSIGDISGQNWGMKIFNSQGEKTFDSRYKIPLITGTLTVPAIGMPSSSTIPAAYATLTGNFPYGVWISVNSFAGMRGFQNNGSNIALCYPAIETAGYSGVTYVVGTYGHQPAGGPSNQTSWDSQKQVFLIPVENPPTSYSGYFDGADDYLTIASNSQLSPGTSNFTIEMWIYPTAYVGSNSLWDLFHKGRVPTADYEYAFVIDFDSSGTSGWLALYIAQDGINWVRYRAPSTNSISLNNWYHVAVSKVGTTAYYLFNGSLVGTATVDSNIPARGGTLAIANNNIGTNPDYTGYISNVRLTVGQAVYTSNYSVPTGPLTADSNTRLLTLQQATLSDASSNNFTITNPGNTVVSNFNPFD